jgi:hypothetical protein
MKGGASGLETEPEGVRMHQINHLERGTGSATVKAEVNADFNRCFGLPTAA